MKNKFFLLSIVCLIFGSLIGCSTKGEESIPNQFETITISNDYLINDKCAQLTSNLKTYLTLIQHYYNHSNKKYFSSFEFNSSMCIDAIDNLESHKNDKILISKESLIQNTVVGYYLKLKYLLSKKDLLISSGNTKSEEWFEELNDELNAIYDSLSNGLNN